MGVTAPRTPDPRARGSGPPKRILYLPSLSLSCMSNTYRRERESLTKGSSRGMGSVPRYVIPFRDLSILGIRRTGDLSIWVIASQRSALLGNCPTAKACGSGPNLNHAEVPSLPRRALNPRLHRA